MREPPQRLSLFYTHAMPKKRSFLLENLKIYRIEIFFLLLALLPALYIAFGNPNTILDWYNSDDGFLYFQVARNLAAGHGFTFDGINPTNGFHPLWLFILTPIFALSRTDPLLPLRILIVVSALLSAGSAILIYRILRQYTSEWIATLVGMLWIVLPSIHSTTVHTGVEAGINAFALLLFWGKLTSFTPDSSPYKNLPRLAILGLLASLALFARLDNIFLVSFGGLWLWLRLWQPPGKSEQNAWLWRLQAGFAFFGPLTLLMAVYLIWNYLSFGMVMPISGEVKVWWGTLKNTVYGFRIRSLAGFAAQFLTDDTQLGPWSLATSPLWAAAKWMPAAVGQVVSLSSRRVAFVALGGMLALLGSALVWAQREFVVKAARALGLLPFFLGCFAQIAYYKFTGSMAQQPWYWIAEMIFLLFAGGLLLHAFFQQTSPLLPKNLGRIIRVIEFAIPGIASILFLVFIQSAVRVPGDGSNHFYINRARWLEANTEEGARIAITGAGNLAYFVRGRTIINMDGLMNTYDYLLAMQAGNGADYLAQLGVDYIFGTSYILTETNPYAPMLDGHLEPYKDYVFADRKRPLWHFVP